MADSRVTALTEVSVPDLADLLYFVDVSDTTDDATGTSRKVTLARLLGQLLPKAIEGRLTLESGVAVSTTDQTAKTTVYYTPYLGNRLSVYDGTRWKLYVFSELSLALGTLTSGKNYDVFVYDNSGTLTLELSAAWTTDTARADALTTQDGIVVKNGATTRRWLGTIRTTSTTTTEDSGGGSTTQVGGKRFVWNAYHRRPRPVAVFDSTASWSYGTASYRQANNNAGNQVEFVLGAAGDAVEAEACSNLSSTGSAWPNGAGVGIGLDSTTVSSHAFMGNVALFDAAATSIPSMAKYRGAPGVGYHKLCWLESGATNAGFGSAAAGARAQSGLSAQLFT